MINYGTQHDESGLQKDLKLAWANRLVAYQFVPVDAIKGMLLTIMFDGDPEIKKSSKIQAAKVDERHINRVW